MRWYHFALAGVVVYGLVGSYLTIALLHVWDYPLEFCLDLLGCLRRPKELFLRLLHFGFGVLITPLVFLKAFGFRLHDRMKGTFSQRPWRPSHIGLPR